MEIRKDILIGEYINKVWLPRKKHELKASTYARYLGLSKRTLAALGSIEMNKLTPQDVYCFYDNLHESKSELTTFVPNEVCIRLLKQNYTRPETAKLGHIGLGTVDALRAGKQVSAATANKVSMLLAMDSTILFKGKDLFLSERTIHHYHRLLFTVVKDAVYDNILQENIMLKVRPPKVDDADEARCLDKTDADVVLKCLNEAAPHPYKELLTLIMYTGMRRGEACGLEWDDINFENKTIIIRRNSYYLPGQGIYTDTPKTKQSRRVLAIGDKAITILQELKHHQSEIKKQAGSGWIDTGRLFTCDNGLPINPSTITKFFHKFVEEHNLPQCCVHTLRHTNASLLIAAQTPITTVAGRLGHSNPEITLRYYAHQISDENRKAAAAIEDII